MGTALKFEALQWESRVHSPIRVRTSARRSSGNRGSLRGAPAGTNSHMVYTARKRPSGTYIDPYPLDRDLYKALSFLDRDSYKPLSFRIGTYVNPYSFE